MTPIQQIKAALPFDQYAARHLNFKHGFAVCPFHKEKTGSLKANKLWGKCFGCGWSGDVISFAAAYHGISTSAAIRMLADELGITLVKQAALRPYDAIKAKRERAEAQQWISTLRSTIIRSKNKALQLQPAWRPEYYERSPQEQGMLPDIGCRWQRIDYSQPAEADDAHDRILVFLERVDAMSAHQTLAAYREQRTVEQAALLRAAIRESDLWVKAMTPIMERLISQ